MRSPLLLFFAALVWGIAFVAQSVGMDYVKPFTFNGARNLLGAAVLVPVILFFDRKKRQEEASENHDQKALLTGGTLCGLCLFAASSLQQIGIQYTTAGKAGFLTAMYIILVPVFGLFMGKKFNISLGISIGLAAAGLYLLSIKDGFSMGIGDIYVLLCATVFAVHILVIDYFAARCDGVKMSCIQFFVCGMLSMLVAVTMESPQLTQVLAAWLPIVYAGVLSCGVGYTLQIVGQKGMNPTVASLILSLESVISVLAGWVLLKQALSGRELLGCMMMFGAIILVLWAPSDQQSGSLDCEK